LPFLGHMAQLILPGSSLPANIRLKQSVRATVVEHDLYDIGRRLQEMHPAIYCLQLEEDDRAAWAIMEDCTDGVQRLMFKTDALDQRVLAKVARIMHVPFEQRLAEAEREVAEHEAKKRETEMEELYERMGRPMWSQMEHDGFIQRNRSYAKGGVYGKRR
jgi:hypothetical protein